jgi:GMP synthase-like glutamine amidotransferase
VRILSLIHQDDAPSGLFGTVAEERGHEVVTWNAANGVPPGAVGDYDAFYVFGGSLQVDEEDRYPWLRPEGELLREALDQEAPIFGVCLGGQLLAKAAGAPVGPSPKPEMGWTEVELLDAAAEDPVFRGLPDRFEALQWHSYAFELPRGAVRLATNPVCLQAYRLGERAWGVQFHPEVDRPTFERWQRHPKTRGHRFDLAPMERWNRIGRELAGRFVDVAARRPRPGRSEATRAT